VIFAVYTGLTGYITQRLGGWAAGDTWAAFLVGLAATAFNPIYFFISYASSMLIYLGFQEVRGRENYALIPAFLLCLSIATIMTTFI
jgi:hypothetical protein